ncbi:N/A [soil metagenome]
MQASWFFRPKPRPAAQLRLFCFPYAGAGPSVFRGWADALPAEVDVLALQAPGREARLREPPLGDLSDLVARTAEQIQPYLDLPAVFFGHSMGALVAFELARRLAAGDGFSPRRLIVSGRRAPQLQEPEPPIRDLSDDDFVAEIRRRYNGIPDELMQHPDLLALLLPGLRADVAALEGYRYRSGEPLDCPVAAVGGADDPRATLAEIQGWREVTRGAFSVRLFPGGHFYLQSAHSRLLAFIGATLRSALDPQLECSGT